MIEGWGDVRGLYRGSRHEVLDATPEEWAITVVVCEARDIWKQNEVYSAFEEVRKMLRIVDEAEVKQ